MAQHTVHNIDDQMVRALKRRALERGQTTAVKRRYFMQKSLRSAAATRDSFARRAAAMRALLWSSVDSTFLSRRYRARDSHP